MILRDATPDDAPAIARMMGDWIATTDWMPKLHSAEATLQFGHDLVREQTVRLVAAPLGMGFLARKEDEVNAFVLDPALRRLGLGKVLLDEAKAATGHLALWAFQANDGARRFYAREGFREVLLTDGAQNFEKLADVRLEWSA